MSKNKTKVTHGLTEMIVNKVVDSGNFLTSYQRNARAEFLLDLEETRLLIHEAYHYGRSIGKALCEHKNKDNER